MPVAEAPAQPAPTHHAQARYDDVERGIFRAVNRARARHGLPSLQRSRRLAFVAALHSADQVRHRFVSHSSSDGTPFYRRIRRVAPARSVGETIIEFSGQVTGRRIVRAWMRSPAHRRELLDAGYRRIGVGRAAGHGVSVVTADFASRH